MTEQFHFLSLEEKGQKESNGKIDVGVSHIEGFGPCLLDKPQREGIKCVSLSVMSKLFATPWTIACQALLSMGFSRQENRSR